MNIDIAGFDQRSRATLDAAMAKANNFWIKEGEKKSIEIDNGPPPKMLFTYDGVRHEVHLQTGGALFELADVFSTPAAVTFCCTMRLRERPVDIADPTASGNARNALFLLPNGQRRDVNNLTSFLVHELTHKQQEIDAFGGKFGFGVGYVFTLGLFYEPEAYSMGDRAFASAIEDDLLGFVPINCSVTITGPTRLCEGETGQYVAQGVPPNGRFMWTPYVSESVDGIRPVGASYGRLFVKAEDDSGVATLTVQYTIAQCRATAAIQIELCEAD